MRKVLFALFCLVGLALPASACDRDEVAFIRNVAFVRSSAQVFLVRDNVRAVTFVRERPAVLIERRSSLGVFPFFSFERTRTIIR